MKSSLKNEVGKRFGLWTVIRPEWHAQSKTTGWLCRCECGTERVIRGPTLRAGKATGCKRCRCSAKERVGAKHPRWKGGKQNKGSLAHANGRLDHASRTAIRQGYRPPEIAIQDLAELYAKDDGRCDLCGIPAKKLVLEHCHQTGRVRGLTCQSCNRALSGIDRYLSDPGFQIAVNKYRSEQ